MSVLLLNTVLQVSEVCAREVDFVEMGEWPGWVTVRDGKMDETRRVLQNAEVRQALKAWLEK